MFLIRIPDDTVNKLANIADSQERSFAEYLTEILEQAARAHELGCSLRETVDLYENHDKEGSRRRSRADRRAINRERV